ncbi:MAG: DNA repair protein RecN [Paludibacter sp.]|nr:DNA repair protein RecN [Paludibacter sp.]
MLKNLYISNYALISELNIGFEKGFSSITGETGAGKSIILGALSLILGQRAESKAIKTDTDKCVIEATFDISEYKKLHSFFQENDIDLDVDCIIRRELTSAGKSRAFINDTPVSLNVLRELTSKLIDIHSQHDNLLLSNENYQLEVVDTIARNSDLLENYQQKFVNWQKLKFDLQKLEKNVEKSSSELEYIQFQHKQLEDARLVPGEQEELETEQETLSHAEEIKSELLSAVYAFEEEKAVLPLMKDINNAISKVKNYLPEAEAWHDRLESAYIELKDIKSEIESKAERVEFNPERLEYVENRLTELFTLQKKYKAGSVAELIDQKDEFKSRLLQIENFDDELAELKKNIDLADEKMSVAARKLTESRKKATVTIEKLLTEQLTKLGMPNIRFQVSISESEVFGETGKDVIQFMFSANKNREMQLVQLIASGGEISRLMLAVKSMIADKSDLPTIIFDEIDTGVSGEIAHKMGDIMKQMGRSMQVITITHLPQIAAKGAYQYKVYKDDSGEQTETYIKLLTPPERERELAQMLSGTDFTEAALQNAKELLGQKSGKAESN